MVCILVLVIEKNCWNGKATISFICVAMCILIEKSCENNSKAKISPSTVLVRYCSVTVPWLHSQPSFSLIQLTAEVGVILIE